MVISQVLRRLPLVVFAMFWAVHAQAQNARIGDAVRINNSVSGIIGSDTVDVSRGDRVFRDQRIITESKSSAQFQFLDETYLAMSENASLVLDKFVYAGKAETGEVTINIAKGAFRFITGKQKSESYRINLPAGVIGVRGTMFDLFVNELGDALVVLLDGAVEFCDLNRQCLDLTNRCEAAALGRDGRLVSARRLSRALLQGARLRDAVPFLTDQTRILSTAQLPGSIVTDCLSAVASLQAPVPLKKPRAKSVPLKKPRAKAVPKQPKRVHKRTRSRAERKCRPGTVKRGTRCVRVGKQCPPGTRKVGKRCKRVLRKCPRGTVRKGKKCVQVGRRCPRGTVRKGKRCIRVVRPCPRGKVRRGKRCVRIKARRCPPGLLPVGGACVRVRLPVPGLGPSRPRNRKRTF
ncbi:MAG: FecR domain-containing protein [Pseudomonadota bacterium]